MHFWGLSNKGFAFAAQKPNWEDKELKAVGNPSVAICAYTSPKCSVVCVNLHLIKEWTANWFCESFSVWKRCCPGLPQPLCDGAKFLGWFNGCSCLLLKKDLLFPIQSDSCFKLPSLHCNTVSGHLFPWAPPLYNIRGDDPVLEVYKYMCIESVEALNAENQQNSDSSFWWAYRSLYPNVFMAKSSISYNTGLSFKPQNIVCCVWKHQIKKCA